MGDENEEYRKLHKDNSRLTVTKRNDKQEKGVYGWGDHLQYWKYRRNDKRNHISIKSTIVGHPTISFLVGKVNDMLTGRM